MTPARLTRPNVGISPTTLWEYHRGNFPLPLALLRQMCKSVGADAVAAEQLWHHDQRRRLLERGLPEAWVELFNRGTQTVDLTGWQLDKGIDFTLPAGTAMAPGSYLVVTGDTNYLRSVYPNLPIIGNFTNRLSHHSDLIALIDASKNPANEVRYYDDGRWPGDADGGGSSLELRNPFADNAQAEAWAASDESTKSNWKSYTYRGIAAADGGPTRWNEFVLGLLNSGEVLLDDISVIESPASAPRELIQNGSFENGATAWRIIGNHRGEVVVDPDNPANHVLHIRSRFGPNGWPARISCTRGSISTGWLKSPSSTFPG